MKNTKGIFSQSITLLKPFWKKILVVVFLYVTMQIISTATPYLFGRGVDAVLKGKVHLTFIFLAIAGTISLIQTVFLSWFREDFEIKNLDDHIDATLSLQTLRKMFGYSVGQHINEHSGVKQSVVNRGQSALTQLSNTILYNLLPTVIQTLVVAIVLFIFDWRVASVAIVFVVSYILIAIRSNKAYFPKIEEVRKKKQGQTKLQSELFRNSVLVISEGQENSTIKGWEEAEEKVTTFHDRTWVDYLKIFYSQKIIIVVGQYASLAVGTYLILIGQHTTGMFVTFFSWTSSIFGNLIVITNAQRYALFQVVEIKKYFDLLEIEPDIDANPNGVTIENFTGGIEFKNVSFAYPYRTSVKEEEIEGGEKKVESNAVSDINLTIAPGSKVGFVGVSGSGKSTLINLMRRYYETTSGSILFDGVDIKTIKLHWLRSQIGNVEQKIELFDRSIRDNILFGLEDKNSSDVESRLQQAVEDASLTEFIAKLKDHGLDTVIGEGGIKISGGERQRIGIARALIKNPKILIFDEATSALDSINEKLIHDAINKGSKGRTTIIIAHRLSTVMDADCIFVVANGKIVGQGKHAELQKSCTEYQELIKNQILVG